MRPSIRLPRQQRPKGGTNRFSGGSSHQALPEAKSLRRDDGPGQAVTRVVDTSSDVITLSADWPTCSSMNPIRRRPRADPGQKPVPGEWITQKGIDSSRPVTEASCAKGRKHTSSHHRFAGTPGLPCAMVLTVSFALSLVTGLSCHHRLRGVSGLLGLTSPFRKLDASVGASGPHDFAVRQRTPSSEAPLASIASRPASVTIAIRPSSGVGWPQIWK
jgi:hypothetical protein